MLVRFAALAALAMVGCTDAHEAERDAAAVVDAVSTDRNDASDHDAYAVDAWAYDPDDLAALQAAWHASCGRYLRCRAESTLAVVLPALCDTTRFAELERHVRAGEVRVDRARMQACVDAIAALPDECVVRVLHVFIATLPSVLSQLDQNALDACNPYAFTADGQSLCGDGLCEHHSVCTSGDACAPVCEPHSAEGESCATTPCVLGLSCDADQICRPYCDTPCELDGISLCDRTTRTCRSRACGAVETCTGRCVDGACIEDTGYGATCSASSSCLPPWTCGPASTCVSSYELHGFCSQQDDCAPDTYCHLDTNTCTASSDGAVCVPQTPGAWLGAYFEIQSCGDGFSCIHSVCARRLPDGATCDDGAHCSNGSTCIDGLCTRTVLPWEACGDGAPCPVAHTCIAGVCTHGSSCVR